MNAGQYAAVGLSTVIVYEIFSEMVAVVFPPREGQSLLLRWVLMGAVAGGFIWVARK